MEKDRVFEDTTRPVSDFAFDESVASVFEDMLVRSVPQYLEIQRMIGELACDFAMEKSNLYDLGCSTGITLKNLDQVLPENVDFVGVDNSSQMLERCAENLKDLRSGRNLRLENQNLEHGIELQNPSVVVLCLTLQFLRPIKRERLVQQIADQLPTNGAVILVEKVLTENSTFNRLFIEHYYDFKRRNGYAEIEISRKREALENILIPYKLSENIELLTDSGFRSAESFFQWYNFTGIIAIK